EGRKRLPGHGRSKGGGSHHRPIVVPVKMRFSNARLVANDKGNAVPKRGELLPGHSTRATSWIPNQNPSATNTLNNHKMLVALRLDERDCRDADLGQAIEVDPEAVRAHVVCGEILLHVEEREPVLLDALLIADLPHVGKHRRLVDGRVVVIAEECREGGRS